MTTRTTTLMALIAVLLPITILAGWTATLLHYRTNAQSYNVIVEGYDPRDLLHGRYLNLRYVWDDAASQKPADVKPEDLPVSAQYYVPEYDALDLETMLREDKNVFSADVALYGKKAQIKSLLIDDKPWEESLAAWRENRDNTDQ